MIKAEVRYIEEGDSGFLGSSAVQKDNWSSIVISERIGYRRSTMAIKLDGEPLTSSYGGKPLHWSVIITDDDHTPTLTRSFLLPQSGYKLRLYHAWQDFNIACEQVVDERKAWDFLRYTTAHQVMKISEDVYGETDSIRLKVDQVLPDAVTNVSPLVLAPDGETVAKLGPITFNLLTKAAKKRVLYRLGTAVAQAGRGLAIDGVNSGLITSISDWKGADGVARYPHDDYWLAGYAADLAQNLVNQAPTFQAAIGELQRIGLMVHFRIMTNSDNNIYRTGGGYKSKVGDTLPATSTRQFNGRDADGAPSYTDMYSGYPSTEDFVDEPMPFIVDPSYFDENTTPRDDTIIDITDKISGVPTVAVEDSTKGRWDDYIGITKIRPTEPRLPVGAEYKRVALTGKNPPWGFTPDKQVLGRKGTNFNSEFNQWLAREVSIIGVQALSRVSNKIYGFQIMPDLNIKTGDVIKWGTLFLFVRSTTITIDGGGVSMRIECFTLNDPELE